MPVATVSTEAQRYDLKSLPPVDGQEGGYIVARPLPYGMVLERRDKGTRMSMEQEVQRGRSRKKSIRQNEPETAKIELEQMSTWMANHDFGYCIVSHNLTDSKGNPLDFTNKLHVQALDPKVGIEIDRILTELNEPEEDEETLEDFTTSQSLVSSDEERPSPSLTTVTN